MNAGSTVRPAPFMRSVIHRDDADWTGPSSELISGGAPEPSGLWQGRQLRRYTSAPSRENGPSEPGARVSWTERDARLNGSEPHWPSHPMLDRSLVRAR